MNFSQSFRYPFRNLARVLSIALTITIAFTFCIGLILRSQGWSPAIKLALGDLGGVNGLWGIAISGEFLAGLLGLLAVALLQGLWLSGYSVQIVRAVVNRQADLPAIRFSENVRDGICLMLASIAYWLILLAQIGLSLAFVSFAGRMDIVGAIAAMALIALLLMSLCVLGWAYYVGLARFALEGDPRAAWQIRRNIRIARHNSHSGFVLLLHMMALVVIYSAIQGVVNGFVGYGPGLAAIALAIAVQQTFQLLQHFSAQHLVAQYAMNIGLRGDNFRD